MSTDCESRRTFIVRAGGCLGTVFLALGLPVDISALPIGTVAGSGSANERTYPMPPADGVNIDHAAGVILARAGGRIFAFALACPHQRAAIQWLAAESRFECTKHHSKYQPTGVFTSGRATRNLDRFPIRRDAANLLVDMTQVFESDKNPSGWGAASVAV